MALVKARIQLFCKVEATDGTFVLAAPAAADLVPEVYDVEIPDPEYIVTERNDARGNLTKSGSIVGGAKGKISFKMRLIGGSAAGTAGPQANVWKSAGYSETSVPTTSITYKRAADDALGYSYAVNVDGHLLGLAGCRADMTFEHENGMPVVANVSVDGVWVNPTDVAFVTPSAQTIKPMPFQAATLSILGEVAAVLRKLTINAGNTIAVRESVLSTMGFVAAKITDARPTAAVDPEATKVATRDRFNEFRNGTQAALSYTMTAGAAGNKLAFTSTYAQWKDIAFGDREGLVTHEGEIELTALQAGGEGSDYSFIWT